MLREKCQPISDNDTDREEAILVNTCPAGSIQATFGPDLVADLLIRPTPARGISDRIRTTSTTIEVVLTHLMRMVIT